MKSIVKKRREFEYKVNRKGAELMDFLRYIQYEITLDKLRKTRINLLGTNTTKHAMGERWILMFLLSGVKKQSHLVKYSGERRVHSIFFRAERRFHHIAELWLNHVRYCLQAGSHRALSRIFARCVSYLFCHFV